MDKGNFSEYIMRIMPKPKSGPFSRSFVALIESRLRELRLSIHGAEKHYGFPPETLRSVIRGSAPSVDRAKQICDALGIGIAFSLAPPSGSVSHGSVSHGLLSREGSSEGIIASIDRFSSGVPKSKERGRLSRHQVCESRDFPILGIVRAGAEIEYWNDQFPTSEHISVPGDIFRGSNGSRWGGVVVRGESMSPTFDDGDILFFDLNFSESMASLLGKACVVETSSGGAMVKRVERGRREGYYNLESYNRLHSVIIDVSLRTARPVRWIKKS